MKIKDIFEIMALLTMLGGLIYYYYLEYRLNHKK